MSQKIKNETRKSRASKDKKEISKERREGQQTINIESKEMKRKSAIESNNLH